MFGLNTEIQTKKADQGLDQILKSCNCQEAVIEYIKASGMTTTSDFLGFFTQSTFESEIADLLRSQFQVTADFKLEQQKLFISRTRAAYKLAMEVVAHVKSDAMKQPEELNPDLERPLDEKTINDLTARWDAMHPFTFLASMKAAPPFRNRLFREIRSKSCKLVPVEKVKSVDDYKTSEAPTSLPVGGSQTDGGRLIFEVQKKKNRRINCTLDYFTALQILMRTYAFCGSHVVEASGAVLLEGSARKIVFFSYGAAVNYIDELTTALLAMGLQSELERLSWLRHRDEAIRTEWVNLINDGIAGDEALATAVSKHRHLFNMKDTLAASNPVDSTAIVPYEPRGQTRAREEKGGKGGGKANKKGKHDSFDGPVRKASMTEDKLKICGAWNSVRGCSDREHLCPQRGKHLCSVILSSGIVCKSRDHNAATHFSR